MIRLHEQVIFFHTISAVLLRNTPKSCKCTHMANCSRGANQFRTLMTNSCVLALMKTVTYCAHIVRMCPPSSIYTIIVIVPAPSANFSCRFIIDMEQQGGLSRNTDSKGFATIGRCPSIWHSLRVSACQQMSLKDPFWMLFCHNYRHCSMLACPLCGIYLTHHQWGLARSLQAALDDLPTFGGTSIRSSHWPVDRQIQWLQVFKYLEQHHLIHNMPASSVAVMQVHSWGLPNRLPSSLPPLPLALGLQCQKLSTWEVEAMIYGLVPG